MKTELIRPTYPKGFRKMGVIFGKTENTNSRNSREIHKFLGVKTRYSDWIKRAIDKYGFSEESGDFSIVKKDYAENGDFAVLKYEYGKGGKFSNIDYIVTEDMAKELCMISPTPKGKETRLYFVYMEKIAKYHIEKSVYDKDATIKKLKERQYAKPRVGDFQLVARIRQDYSIEASTHELNQLLAGDGILIEEVRTITDFVPNTENNFGVRQGNSTLVYVGELLALVDELEIPRGTGYEDHAPRLDI